MSRALPIFLLLLAGLTPILAADCSEQFLTAYQNFQQGQNQERAGNNDEALKKYHFAESLLVGIAQSDPSWQKPVVEYRLKKVRESIGHLQSGSSDGSTIPVEQSSVEASPAVVQRSATSGPSITIVPPGSSKDARSYEAAGDSSSANQEVQRLKNMIVDLKGQLEEARSALESQRTRASDLESAEWVKQRSELTNELDQAKRRISDLERDLKSRSAWGDELKDLQKKLDDAVADKLVADEQYQDSLKKASSENEALSRQLKDAAQQLALRVDSKQKIDQLTHDIETGHEAMQQLEMKLEHSEQMNKEAAAKNEELRKKGDLVAAQLATIQKQLETSAKAAKRSATEANARAVADDADRAALEEDRERLQKKLEMAGTALKSLRDESASVAPLRAEIEKLNQQLAGNNKELNETKPKLAEAQQTASTELVKEKQRSEASESLKKMLQQQDASLHDQLRASLDRLSLLVSGSPDAAGLQEQLKKLQAQIDLNTKNYDDSRQQISDLLKMRPEQEKALQEKEKSLAEARKQAEGFKTELASAKQKISTLQDQGSKGDELIKKMQDQLSDKDLEIAKLKKRKGKISPDDKTVEENTLLRGIVLRELKDEAKRVQAKRLMEEELKRLNVQSQSIADQITVLSAPTVELSASERALFKDAQLQISESVPSKLDASISVSKQADGSSVSNTNAANASSGTSSEHTNQTGSQTDGGSPKQGNQAPDPSKTVDQSPSSSGMPWQGKYKELLSRAKEEFDRQDYLQAENTFQEALKLSPNDYFALSNLGVVQFQLGKMAEAEHSLKSAAEKVSDNSFALTTLGIVHYRQQRLPEAESVLRKSVSINDMDFTAHNYLGIVLAASGKGRAGESEIMRALEINPRYADAHFNLAVIYATGKPPSKMLAKKHYSKAIELGSPPDPSLEHLIE